MSSGLNLAGWILYLSFSTSWLYGNIHARLHTANLVEGGTTGGEGMQRPSREGGDGVRRRGGGRYAGAQ